MARRFSVTKPQSFAQNLIRTGGGSTRIPRGAKTRAGNVSVDLGMISELLDLDGSRAEAEKEARRFKDLQNVLLDKGVPFEEVSNMTKSQAVSRFKGFGDAEVKSQSDNILGQLVEDIAGVTGRAPTSEAQEAIDSIAGDSVLRTVVDRQITGFTDLITSPDLRSASPDQEKLAEFMGVQFGLEQEKGLDAISGEPDKFDSRDQQIRDLIGDLPREFIGANASILKTLAPEAFTAPPKVNKFANSSIDTVTAEDGKRTVTTYSREGKVLATHQRPPVDSGITEHFVIDSRTGIAKTVRLKRDGSLDSIVNVGVVKTPAGGTAAKTSVPRQELLLYQFLSKKAGLGDKNDDTGAVLAQSLYNKASNPRKWLDGASDSDRNEFIDHLSATGNLQALVEIMKMAGSNKQTLKQRLGR